MGEHYFEPSNRHWKDFGGVPRLESPRVANSLEEF